MDYETRELAEKLRDLSKRVQVKVEQCRTIAQRYWKRAMRRRSSSQLTIVREPAPSLEPFAPAPT